ncbi:hypothetical protein BDN70DRAFT_100787 [Pholiota conissans]|uniref:Uncharacterized protein n=1 Tax=Pholiota conissans TaxID=109636 RepID=A0A9P5YYJ9_9AGAR|nr:hypothetical protein BDN70DRAFT_100787 [Pholiota conissans]
MKHLPSEFFDFQDLEPIPTLKQSISRVSNAARCQSSALQLRFTFLSEFVHIRLCKSLAVTLTAALILSVLNHATDHHGLPSQFDSFFFENGTSKLSKNTIATCCIKTTPSRPPSIDNRRSSYMECPSTVFQSLYTMSSVCFDVCCSDFPELWTEGLPTPILQASLLPF